MNGIVIKIDAPKRTYTKILEEVKESKNKEEEIKRIQNHQSETELNNFNEFDFIINNDDEINNEIIDTIIDNAIKKLFL